MGSFHRFRILAKPFSLAVKARRVGPALQFGIHFQADSDPKNHPKTCPKTNQNRTQITGLVLDRFWAPLLVPICPNFSQDGPLKPLQGTQENASLRFQKPLKHEFVVQVFETRGLPREPQESQKGSQGCSQRLSKRYHKCSKLRS